MGLFRTPDVNDALAATVISFSSAGVVSVDWEGDPGLLVRSPAIYLHWAVLKSSKKDALATIEAVRGGMLLGQVSGDYWGDPMHGAFPHSSSPVGADHAHVTISYNELYRCNPAFRPRMAVVRLMLPTFWALWNEVAERVGEEPTALAALADDMLTQLDLYEHRGVGGLRSGNAPMDAAGIGASRRLAQEIAAFAGISEEEFRALPELERSRIIGQHSRAAIDSLDSES